MTSFEIGLLAALIVMIGLLLVMLTLYARAGKNCNKNQCCESECFHHFSPLADK